MKSLDAPRAPTRMGFLIAVLVLSQYMGAALAAQNLLYHNDGVQEAFSRGLNLPLQPVVVIQRFPEEQWCGRQCLACVTVEFQDLTPASPEPFSIEVRQGLGPANLPADTPDMTGAGLLCPPIFAVKPGGLARVLMTIALFPCCPLPPGKDTYVCVVLPRNDLQVWHSRNEAHRAVAIPCGLPARYGVFPIIGLAWGHDPVAVVSTPLGNGSWAIGASIVEDVCQAFAAGPFPVGPPNNYGYVGIYPELAPRLPPDRVGWRLRTSHPVGSPCALFLGLTKLAVPFNLAFLGPQFSGFLCLDNLITLNGLTTLGGGACVSVSEAVFGPLVMPPIACGLDVCAQVASLDPGAGTIRMSTACVVDM